MRAMTTPVGALVRWLVVFGNVAVVVAVATISWHFAPVLLLVCALPWLALPVMAPWRYRERSATGVQLRLLVLRRTRIVALVLAVAVTVLALSSGHSWRASLVFLLAAELSLTDSLAL